MGLRKTIGRVAGGTLGYIVGNIPGAIIGSKIGGRLSEMKTKRRLIGSKPSGPRRKKQKKVHPVKPKVSKVQKTTTDRSVVSYKKKGSGRGVVKKSVKKVHVSRQFKGKVKAALSDKRSVGYYEQQSYQIFDNTVSNRQFSFNIFSPGTAAGVFSPVRIRDAVSVLFNNKTPLENPAGTLVNMIDDKGIKVNVLSAYLQTTMKNNTLRKKHIVIRDFVGKGKDYDNAPLDEWASSLSQDTTVGTALGSQTMDPLNQNSVSQSFIGIGPKSCKRMREVFNWTEKVYILEPGQDIMFTHNATTSVYDFSKYIEAAGPVPEFCKPTHWITCTMYNDVVQTAAGVPGRITDQGTIGQGVIFAHRMVYRIEKPEWAGFAPALPLVLGVSIPLNLATADPYCYVDFGIDTGVSAPNRVDEINPVVVELP